MKLKMLVWTVAMMLIAALAISVQLEGQEHHLPRTAIGPLN